MMKFNKEINMNAKNPSGGNSISIGGDNSGQVGIGDHVVQTNTVKSSLDDASADLDTLVNDLKLKLAELERSIVEEMPPEKRNSALERAEELKETLMSGKPSTTTIEYVKNWFGQNAPKLSGMIAGIVIHPIVGRLVETAGDALAEEVRRRLSAA
jgi:hypothetical protein